MSAASDHKNEVVKKHYAEVEEDKFTGVMSASGLQKIIWEGESVEFKLGGFIHKLMMNISYSKLQTVETLSFTFTYSNGDGGFVGMSNMTALLLLNGTNRIILNKVTHHDAQNRTHSSHGQVNLLYMETAVIDVSISDFIALANANSIDYRIQMRYGIVEGSFTSAQLAIIKGFYNNVFDNDFEVDFLYDEIEKEKTTKKNSEKPDKKSGACYIATMAYGNYDHPQVMKLRHFRDNDLSNTSLGRRFIGLYYWFSPSLVKLLKGKKRINTMIRKVLNLFIVTIEKSRKK